MLVVMLLEICPAGLMDRAGCGVTLVGIGL